VTGVHAAEDRMVEDVEELGETVRSIAL